MTLVVVDCDLGNIGSVLNMVRKMGGVAKRSSSADEVAAASKLILPGVGAFDYGMEKLHQFGLVDAIRARAGQGAPLLGICLGMHLLGNRSEEGESAGIGLIQADFKRFSFEGDRKLRVPHVGWNHVHVMKENSLIPADGSEQRFYFTHSYHAVGVNEEDVLATAGYGYDFPVALSRDNVFGVQFHPEKSHLFGMALIKNFLDL